MFLLKAIEKVSNMFILLSEKVRASKIVLKETRVQNTEIWREPFQRPFVAIDIGIFCVQLFLFYFNLLAHLTFLNGQRRQGLRKINKFIHFLFQKFVLKMGDEVGEIVKV